MEYCDKSIVIEREQYYIDLLLPEYNVLKIAGLTMGYLHTEEARAKISAAHKGENNPMYGIKRIHTEETLARTKKNNFFCYPLLQKKIIFFLFLRVAGAGKPSERVLVLDLQTNVSTEYDSINSAARALNTKPSRFTMYFNRNQNKPFKGRYIFKKL